MHLACLTPFQLVKRRWRVLTSITRARGSSDQELENKWPPFPRKETQKATLNIPWRNHHTCQWLACTNDHINVDWRRVTFLCEIFNFNLLHRESGHVRTWAHMYRHTHAHAHIHAHARIRTRTRAQTHTHTHTRTRTRTHAHTHTHTHTHAQTNKQHTKQ